MKKIFSMFYIVSIVLIISLAAPMYSEAANISEEGHWYEDIVDFDTDEQDKFWDEEIDYSDESLAELLDEYYSMKREVKQLDRIKAGLKSSKVDDEKELKDQAKKKGLFSSILSIMEKED